MIEMTCTRCSKVRPKLVPIFTVRVGSYSMLSLSLPDAVERVCAPCLTDDEIARELNDVAEFVLGVLVKNTSPEYKDMLVSLETARSYFAVRNNDNRSNRGVALRALGFGEQ